MLFSNLSIILKKIIIPHFVQRPGNVYKLVKNYRSIEHDWEKRKFDKSTVTQNLNHVTSVLVYIE